MDKKRIVYMGTPDYATVIFERLLEADYEISALFTQPDKPVGRKQLMTPPHIKKFVLDHGLSLPVYQPATLREKAVVQTIKDLNPDIIIVAAYGQILPKDVLEIAPCINLHASLLPLYRGASPIQQSLLNNDDYTGVTAMLMDEGLDSGDILALKYVKIEKETVVEELFNSLSGAAADLTIEVLENFENIKAKVQSSCDVSHCGKVNKQEGFVDFKNASTVYNKYRAYKSWPDIFLDSGLKIKECGLIETLSKNKPGAILDIQKDHIIAGCEKGTLKIMEVQPKSKKQMNVVDYIRGKRLEVGDDLS